MKNNKKLWVLIALGLVLLVGLIFYLTRDTGESNSLRPSGNLVTFNGADLHESKDGNTSWTLKAEKIEYDPKTKDLYFTKITGTFVKDGRTLTIVAPEGRMTNNRANLDLAGGVWATSTDGIEFSTTNLHFDNTRKVLTSNEPFTYKKEGTTLTGDKLETDMTMEVVQAIGHAKLTKEG